MKLNMNDVQKYSLFEGEIIVAEGFLDTSHSKFNVNRIFKP
jgi:DNA polymerase alpha subunit B